MSEVKKAKRNETVDILRGIAMLCVVLQHTMSGSTIDAEYSFIFQVVWSLQMPLFCLLSGYVAHYSKRIQTFTELKQKVCRRTIAYILPWIVWSFLIRGLLFGAHRFLNISYLLWHMDTGYWFLVSIWTINILFLLSQFLAEQVKSKIAWINVLLEMFFYLASMVILLGIGICVGMTFLAIKQTLYYMPFYYIGYLFGRNQVPLMSKPFGTSLTDAAIPAALFIWLFLIKRFNMFYIEDGGIDILIRAAASITGCIAVSGLISSIAKKSAIFHRVGWIGKNSIGIYTVHYLLLNLLSLSQKPMAETWQGVLIVMLNYFLTIILASAGVVLIKQNRWIRLLLLGKR